MSYALGQVALTRAQANRAMGWSSSKLRSYWDARARACQEMGDEGECLAQVARHVPVTIGGLGDLGLTLNEARALKRQLQRGLGDLGQVSAQDVSNIAAVAASIISNPDATLRVQGPRIVAALDQHVVGPVIGAATQRATPYLMRYLGPPMLLLYLMTGLSTYWAYQVYLSQHGRVAKNSRRRMRRRRSRR